MALPGSGPISISQINTELGRTSTTANSSLYLLSIGYYVAFNTNSPSYPNATAPHSMSEWYNYNHSAAPPPTINSVSQSTVSYPNCGVEWIINVSWNTSNANDTLYKVVIKSYGTNNILADNLTTSSSSWTHYTGSTGDATYSTYYAYQRYTVSVVRKSDGGGAGSADTGGEGVYHGDSC